eukprot:GHVT01068649.1.p1 GENE.GHVT01068649.1~~GHVT01068649.1.p1  ORF type:complete len:200 (+),score=17.99 GHVT01068649.1:608-1207(+)
MSAEGSGVQSQQVEGPTGLPRCGAASWAPQSILTSTPVGQELLNFVDAGQQAVVQTGAFSVVEQATTHDCATPDAATGLVQSPGSLRRDEERLARLRNPAVNDRAGNSPALEDRELYARMQALLPQFEEALSASASESRDRRDADRRHADRREADRRDEDLRALTHAPAAIVIAGRAPCPRAEAVHGDRENNDDFPRAP